MSKLAGASLIALGTGGIALALLKDTKYDPLIRLKITKPKIISKVQQNFHCEVLFLKLSTNYFETFEIQKQINEIIRPQEGIVYNSSYPLDEQSKKKVAELQLKKDKAQKIFEDSVKEYNETICGSEMNVMDCVNNGNCLKTTQFSSDCLETAKAYLEEYYTWTEIEKDISALNNADFQKKYTSSLIEPKAYYIKNLPIKKANLEVLKKAYDNCDVANVDCASLKEDIATLTEQYNNYKADPDSNRSMSPAKGNMDSTKRKLDIKQQLYDKTYCSTKSNIRTGVSYKDVRDCVELDQMIKSYKDEIVTRERKKLELGSRWLPSSELRLSRFKTDVMKYENDFINKGCKARLESEKLKENAITLTDMSSQQEANVLKKNVTEQYAYIGIGALVLLTGFYMVLKK
jgi:hypothetical protein